jgi:hypothetical protein
LFAFLKKTSTIGESKDTKIVSEVCSVCDDAQRLGKQRRGRTFEARHPSGRASLLTANMGNHSTKAQPPPGQGTFAIALSMKTGLEAGAFPSHFFNL